MNIEIRTERMEDLPSIADIHAMAFTHIHGMGEVSMVDAHRHRRGYDPQLSLVATIDGKVVGHVLFTLWQVAIEGKPLIGAILSPIAVHPSCQKLGIGGRLIEEGHRRLSMSGCIFSLLIGHPSYYPRFGYQTGLYGGCNTVVSRHNVPQITEPLTERRLTADDIPQIIEMWRTWFDDVDLSIFPGESLTDWISPDRATTASAICNAEDGRLVGYVRYSRPILGDNSALQVLGLLSVDGESLSNIASLLFDKVDPDRTELLLPIHPLSSAAQRLIRIPFEAKVQPWKAAMIKVITENELIERYCSEVSSGNRPIGHVVWPVAFDVCP